MKMAIHSSRQDKGWMSQSDGVIHSYWSLVMVPLNSLFPILVFEL